MKHSQDGFAHLFLILVGLVLLVGAGVVIFLVSQGRVSLPGGPQAARPSVSLKTEYKNPFAKESQYVNPFDEFKSPFVNL